METQLFEYGVAIATIFMLFKSINKGIDAWQNHCDASYSEAKNVKFIEEKIINILENNTQAMQNIEALCNMLRVEIGKQQSMLNEVIRSQQNLMFKGGNNG